MTVGPCRRKMQMARLVWGFRGPEVAWIVQGRDDSGLDGQTGIEENGPVQGTAP